MKGLGEFVTVFCGSCILLGALFTLVPQGALLKPVKYLFCLLYLCCLLSVSLKAEDFFPIISENDYEFAASEDAAKASAELTISHTLENGGIDFSKISVITDISQDGSITFNEVIIHSSADPDSIRGLLGNPQEYEVTVIGE